MFIPLGCSCRFLLRDQVFLDPAHYAVVDFFAAAIWHDERRVIEAT
jgi:hypothetical protein